MIAVRPDDQRVWAGVYGKMDMARFIWAWATHTGRIACTPLSQESFVLFEQCQSSGARLAARQLGADWGKLGEHCQINKCNSAGNISVFSDETSAASINFRRSKHSCASCFAFCCFQLLVIWSALVCSRHSRCCVARAQATTAPGCSERHAGPLDALHRLWLALVA